MSRRVLMVLIEPPLPFGNAAARWYYVLLKGLVERGHRVTAFATSTKPDEAEEARGLFPAPVYDLRTYPVTTSSGIISKLATLRRPFSYVFNADLRRDLRRELAIGCDVLHLEHTWGGWLGMEHRRKSLVHVHFLYRIDLAGQRAMDPVRLALTIRAEGEILRSYPNISTLSPRLTEVVGSINKSAIVETVPLGLDASLYPFDPGPTPPRRPTVGLIGSFNWQPSFAAAERLFTRLWPEIARQVPAARLQVVGRRAKSALARFLETPGLEIAEDVPDPIPYFQSTDVLLYAPGQGSGMKVKILEAFALGTPVVMNAEGAEGIPAVDGVHAGIADDDDGLIRRTVSLLRDADARLRQKLAARQLVELHCGPRPTVDAIDSIHARIAAG